MDGNLSLRDMHSLIAPLFAIYKKYQVKIPASTFILKSEFVYPSTSFKVN